ncbi:TerD family protein [Streptomyces thinghirensis]|nr:TerD family protein [Streptomyces thinghirensis]
MHRTRLVRRAGGAYRRSTPPARCSLDRRDAGRRRLRLLQPAPPRVRRGEAPAASRAAPVSRSAGVADRRCRRWTCARWKRPSTASSYDASADGGTFGQVPGLSRRLLDTRDRHRTGPVRHGGRGETALVGGELYRRQGKWKFRAVGRGYVSGLAGVATDFGITVDDAPSGGRARRPGDPADPADTAGA